MGMVYRHNVPEMEWRAQSLDLNPIEHLWDELESRLLSRPQRPTSLIALATTLQDGWAAIPPETFRHLLESLPAELELSQRQRVLMSTTGKYVTRRVGLQF
jgi:hypothetical protein